jgi:uncharacterized protein (TIGR02246 family)
MEHREAEEAMRSLFQRMLDAWSAGNAQAYAALFAEDAHYLAFDGVDQRGRAAIEAAHRPLFERYLKGSRLIGELVDVRVLSEGVVLGHAIGSILDRGMQTPKPERLSSQTLVAIREGEIWRFVAFHNTRVRPIMSSLRGFAAWKLTDIAWTALGPKPAHASAAPEHH